MSSKMMMHGFGISFMLVAFFGALLALGFVGILVRWLNRRGAGFPRESLRGQREGGDRSVSEIYRLAHRLGGRLTVSDLVIHLDYGPQDAERLLEKMTDSIRVRMNVTENGLIFYEFVEVITSNRTRESQKDGT